MNMAVTEENEKDYENVAGILIGFKYRCPYMKGWMRPDYVNEEKDYVIFYHNPGWIGSWHWMTSIENFKNNFFPKAVEPANGSVSGVHYVSIAKGYDKPEIIKGRKVFGGGR